MTTQLLTELIPYLVVGLLGLALMLFVLALHQLRRGRKGPYWRIRRQAGQRGGRLFLLSIGLFALALAIGFFSGFAALALNRVSGSEPTEAVVVVITEITAEASETDAPTVTPTSSATPTIVPTDLPTATATATPTNTPTITPTPTDTPIPTATYETALHLDSLPGARPASEGAMVQLLAADTGVSVNDTPLEPRTQFQPGLQRIYLFFTYRNMTDGAAWTRILYRDGTALQGGTLLWSLGSEGSSYFFFGDETGYPPGQYRVELRLGEEIASEFAFEVLAG